MSEKPYENREIDEKFIFIKEKLGLIHEQTIKTNDRVSRHDERLEEINNWRANLMGKVAIVTFLIAGIASGVISGIFNDKS